MMAFERSGQRANPPIYPRPLGPNPRRANPVPARAAALGRQRPCLAWHYTGATRLRATVGPPKGQVRDGPSECSACRRLARRKRYWLRVRHEGPGGRGASEVSLETGWQGGIE